VGRNDVLVKKTLGGVAGVLAFVGLIAPVIAASPASAASSVEVKSVSITHCLDELANSSHAVALTSCEGAPNEEWTIAVLPSETDTIVRFQNIQTGACLAERPGTGVIVTGCSTSDPDQQWDEFNATVGGAVPEKEFISVAISSTEACLNQTGFNVDVAICNDSDAQAWELG
jgi:hypothetical protein